MASSRESSPGNGPALTSPHRLTPNSKIKALLASLDNDSDDETTSGSARAGLGSLVTKEPTIETPPFINPKTTNQNSTSRELATDSSSDGDDEDEDIVRPKGRMAARMLATNGDSNPEAENNGDNARERVKRMLMNSTNPPEPTISDRDAGDSEKTDTPVVPQKRKVRVPRRGTPTSSPAKSPAHSTLFVSPAKSTALASNASDSEELPANPLQNERFKALVEKKRQERLGKEALEAAQKEKRMAERRTEATMVEEDDVNDDFMERRLTQQTKPTRKASKAAIEKIAQETQRMSRSMQLTHDARTKNRFSKVDLFDIYEYDNEPSMKEEQPELASSSPARHYSDAEMHETPPTSPVSNGSDVEKSPKSSVVAHALSRRNGPLNMENQLQIDEDLPARDFSLAPTSPRKLNKGKGRATEKSLTEPKLENIPLFKQRPVRIQPPITAEGIASTLDDSDSDLEIITTKTPATNMIKSNTLFDRVPAKQANESHSIHTLKMLSHLKSPGKQNLGKNQKPHMTATELQLSLQQRARLQAAREKEEKFEALKAKGVILPTAEERERALAEVEDLMAKARREGEDIRQKEKAAAKMERKENGEEDPLGDSSDDEDWNDGKEKADELSGSGSEDDQADASDASSENEEEEDDELAPEGEGEAQSALTNPMFDNEADETDDDEVEVQLSIDEDMVEPGDLEDAQEDEGPAIVQRGRRARKSNVISDDEDEDEGNPVTETPSAPRTGPHTQPHTDSPIAPNSVLRSATKTFIPGLPVTGAAGLGLTQIFAGTIGESQLDACDESMTPNSYSQVDGEQDSLAFLRRLPAPDLPPFVPTMEDSQVVMDSQPGTGPIPESQSTETQTQTQGLQLMFSQSQIHGFDSLVDPMATQFSGFPSATQDAGFQHVTPVKGRFAEPPPSTVDTVVMGPATIPEHPQEETPIVKKKGKLRRRAQVATFSDDEGAGEPAYAEEQEDDFEISANAFDVMRRASKKDVVVDEFDKKTSKAKEMVNEQADESEDEYAGLGGASDDESGSEEDEYVKEMIDDEGGKDVDERKLAAFFA
jgi:mediator of replication checkpoint protein 1